MMKSNVRYMIPLFALFVFSLFFVLPSCNVQDPLVNDDGQTATAARYHQPANWDGNLTVYISNDQNVTLEAMLEKAYAGLADHAPRPAVGLSIHQGGIWMSQAFAFRDEFQGLYGNVGSVGVFAASDDQQLSLLSTVGLDPEATYSNSASNKDVEPVLVACGERCSKVTSSNIDSAKVGGVVFVGNCSAQDSTNLIRDGIRDCTQGRINSYNIACPDNCPCNYTVTGSEQITIQCLQPNQVRQWTSGACTMTVVGPLTFYVTVNFQRGKCDN